MLDKYQTGQLPDYSQAEETKLPGYLEVKANGRTGLFKTVEQTSMPDSYNPILPSAIYQKLEPSRRTLTKRCVSALESLSHSPERKLTSNKAIQSRPIYASTK